MTEDSLQKAGRIRTLDGWRAVAILGVVWYHAMDAFLTHRDALYVTASRFGRFGVDIFFGLSGMLITGILLKQWGQTGAISLKAFYIRRAFRILPVYLLFLGGWSRRWVGCMGPENSQVVCSFSETIFRAI